MSLLSLVFIIVATLSACGGGTPVGPVSTDSAATLQATDVRAVIELRYDEIASFQDLRFRWIKLEDSRCQIGVQCVWAGQLVATIEVARGTETPVEVDLVHRIGSDPEKAVAYGYTLRLQAVDPHPKRGVTYTRSNYVMRIDIAKP